MATASSRAPRRRYYLCGYTTRRNQRAQARCVTIETETGSGRGWDLHPHMRRRCVGDGWRRRRGDPAVSMLIANMSSEAVYLSNDSAVARMSLLSPHTAKNMHVAEIISPSTCTAGVVDSWSVSRAATQPERVV